MKVTLPFLVLLLMLPMVQAQQGVREVDRLCGRLQYIRRIPDHQYANVLSEERKPLRGVNLVLCERRQNEPCCKGASAMETVRTRRGGRFDFRNKRAGDFWLVANWSGRDYRIPVTYKPVKELTTVCSEQGLDLDDEANAGWSVAITLE